MLVLRGDTGIGKSHRLEYAIGRAGEMCVLPATGVDAESELAYAGLHQLLRPSVRRIEGLPAAQAQALRAAFA